MQEFADESKPAGPKLSDLGAVPNDGTYGGIIMDEDRQKGMVDKAKGAVKKNVGKATGDRKTEAEGHIDQAKGDIRNTVGGIKDSVREKE